VRCHRRGRRRVSEASISTGGSAVESSSRVVAGFTASTYWVNAAQFSNPYSRATTNCASASIGSVAVSVVPMVGIDGAYALHGGGIAAANEVQQILGLFAELLQRRTRGQPRGGVGHGDLLSRAARVRTPG
jgi:hypothetical protein